MVDVLGDMRRTHNCSELTASDVGKEVILMGWVHRRRDLGNLIFIDMRDREGLTQVVFNPEVNLDAHAKAHVIRNEFVIGVIGSVEFRPNGMHNLKLPTGQVEVSVRFLKILNLSNPLLFNLDDDMEAFESLRLEHRYLDLKRPKLQKAIIKRHKASESIRNFLNNNGFIDIETPILTKSTPEGARDYLVPSRINHGKFYALPQSPQLFKQLLMVSGFDRYYQIVRCFRDEDLRSDRQPEFTQIDIEMSFVDREDIMSLSENMMQSVFRDVLGMEIEIPFPRLKYREAIDSYGLDKPDLRFDLKLIDVSEFVKYSKFKLFFNAIKMGGVVKAINIKGFAHISRSKIDDFIEFVKPYGAKGLVWIKILENSWKSPIAKFFTDHEKKELIKEIRIKEGDLVIFIADDLEIVNESLGNLRKHIAIKLNLINESFFNFLWITDFPMFEYDKNKCRYQARHHPFTSPRGRDFFGDPSKISSLAYDLVLNGFEVGGGSIRIHEAEMQRKVFEFLKMESKDYEEKFGFLLKALESGAPPHGGIAFGFDRLVMLLCRESSIKSVIAFPKSLKAACLLTGAPSKAERKQLEDLSLLIKS